MSFRYKSALLSLVSMAAIYGWFFLTVTWGPANPANQVANVALLVLTVVLLALVQAIGHVILAITSRDKYGAMDERERGFDQRATNVSYYVLIAGALAAIWIQRGEGGFDMGHAVLLAIVVAECARQMMFLFLHHRAA
jgi:hypothetical protein